MRMLLLIGITVVEIALAASAGTAAEIGGG
jgi:hypothetical protein